MLNEHLNDKGIAQRLAKYDKIFVDELSMVPARWMIILSNLPDASQRQILLFGDMNQCTPIEESNVWYDYTKKQLTRELTNYRRVDLEYVEGRSRYGETLYHALEQLLDTKISAQ